MKHLPLKRIVSYAPELLVRHEDGSAAGYMERVGFTPIGYPQFAVYGERPFRIGDPTMYVLEKGRFWPYHEWLLYYRETGETPCGGGLLSCDEIAECMGMESWKQVVITFLGMDAENITERLDEMFPYDENKRLAEEIAVAVSAG